MAAMCRHNGMGKQASHTRGLHLSQLCLALWHTRVLLAIHAAEVAWPPGHLSAWSPGRLVTCPPGHLSAWSPGRLVTWPPGHLASQSPGHPVTWPPGHLAAWSPGRLVTWLPGHLASQSPGHPVTWPPGHLAARSPGRLVTWPTGRPANRSPGRPVTPDIMWATFKRFTISGVTICKVMPRLSETTGHLATCFGPSSGTRTSTTGHASCLLLTLPSVIIQPSMHLLASRLLPAAEFAINNTFHASIGNTPFRLAFGLDPCMPLSVVPTDGFDCACVAKFHNDWGGALCAARQHMQAAQQCMKA
eukprot:366121-Chlamydomonas_euryale.AAC.4